MEHSELKKLLTSSKKRAILVVVDGLGGLPHPDFENKTELEYARLPNLDSLAENGMCGVHIPVRSAITPGSVDAHIGLFGFDPFQVQIGRGAVEAAGVGFEMGPDDVAARCNWVTLHGGKIVDRRAGRMAYDYYSPLIDRLKGVTIPGVKTFVIQGAEHRFVVIFRRKGLGADVSDTDPQKLDENPLEPYAYHKSSRDTVRIVKEFIDKASKLLHDEPVANGFTMRGFSKLPKLEQFDEAYDLNSVGIASHPLYKGLARLFGMEVMDCDGKQPYHLVNSLTSVWGTYDFYYVHFKLPDSFGEDGNFIEKVRSLEEIDSILPDILNLGADVLVLTGDHCTPSKMNGHSWHAVPIVYHGDTIIPDSVTKFTERTCNPQGANTLTTYSHETIMPNILAMMGKLKKYGP